MGNLMCAWQLLSKPALTNMTFGKLLYRLFFMHRWQSFPLALIPVLLASPCVLISFCQSLIILHGFRSSGERRTVFLSMALVVLRAKGWHFYKIAVVCRDKQRSAFENKILHLPYSLKNLLLHHLNSLKNQIFHLLYSLKNQLLHCFLYSFKSSFNIICYSFKISFYIIPY